MPTSAVQPRDRGATTPRATAASTRLATLVVLALVFATGAEARSLMKRAADEIRRARDATEQDRPRAPVAEDAGGAPAAAPAADPAGPPRVALDRSQPWAAACEADARVRVPEHRPGAEDVVFAPAGATEWQEAAGVRGVEGTGDFLGWGGSRTVFSYRCRYDQGQGKVTWGRVTIGR